MSSLRRKINCLVRRRPEATQHLDDKQSFTILSTTHRLTGTMADPLRTYSTDPTLILRRSRGTTTGPSDEESLDYDMKAPPIEPRPHIEKLPAELYVQLLGYMQPRYGVLLSLTCKKLWSMVSLKSNQVLHDLKRCEHLSARIEFLDLLEKDSMKSVRCTVCMVLHRRSYREDTLFQRYGGNDRPCARASGSVGLGDTHSWTPNPLGVSREGAELLLRGYLHGAEYGLPVSKLRQETKGYAYGEIRTSVNFEPEGRIHSEHKSDPRLVVRTKYRIEVHVERKLDPQIRAAEAKGCGHHAGAERDIIVGTVRNVIRDTDEVNVSKSYNVVAAYRCPSCPTDMEAVAHRIPGECFVSVTVEAWRDLGGRGDHTESGWQRQCVGYISASEPFSRGPQFDYVLGERSLKEVFDVSGSK